MKVQLIFFGLEYFHFKCLFDAIFFIVMNGLTGMYFAGVFWFD